MFIFPRSTVVLWFSLHMFRKTVFLISSHRPHLRTDFTFVDYLACCVFRSFLHVLSKSWTGKCLAKHIHFLGDSCYNTALSNMTKGLIRKRNKLENGSSCERRIKPHVLSPCQPLWSNSDDDYFIFCTSFPGDGSQGKRYMEYATNTDNSLLFHISHFVFSSFHFLKKCIMLTLVLPPWQHRDNSWYGWNVFF